MPKRIVVSSIRLARDSVEEITIINGQKIKTNRAVTISPKIGEVFEFTTAEIDFLNEHAPRSIRHPRNEEADLPSTVLIDPKTAVDADGKPLKVTKADKTSAAETGDL